MAEPSSGATAAVFAENEKMVFGFPARILDSEAPVSSRGVESVTGYNSCSCDMKQRRSLSNDGRGKADRTRNRQHSTTRESLWMD
jgi:hypothetical protein